MEEIITPEKIKENFKEKIINIKNRLDMLVDNLEIDNNIESFTNIYDYMVKIEEEIIKLENNLTIENIADIEERNRILDQKILKLFSPFILYYKLCLLQNT